jgi:hypothetical protein
MSGAARWVSVAEAARLLSASGDKIDASNVSRYLARFPAIPTRKDGKFRMVNLDALLAHRAENVQVADRQAARGMMVAAAPPLQPALVAPSAEPEQDAPAGSPMQAINLQIKELELRRKKREEDLADGTVIAAAEVIALISATMTAFVGALARQEVEFTQRHGKVIGSEFRRARKSAQADAARHLSDLANKHLPAAMRSDAMAAVPKEAELVGDTPLA